MWAKTTTVSSTDPITIEVDGNANAILTVKTPENGGADSLVSQKITGLKSGRSYSASVWVNVAGGCRAWIGIQGVKNWVDRTDHIRSEGRMKYRGTTFQRLAVVFTMPHGKTEATLFLRTAGGTPGATAQFDDVRIAELPGRTPQGKHHLFEDFENVDEQWGPFVAAGGTDHTHLSELNPGITDDTINGRFSLKNKNESTSGEIYRTVQSTLKLAPNTRYRIGFRYINKKANYHVTVKTQDGGDNALALDEAIPEGRGKFSAVFKTGKYTDYYIAFETEKSHGHLFVIDDFLIDEK